ncbi:MAG: putative lipid flippase FtsW [Chloroflexota bacterium]|jgi:cell division protein FtsW
MSRLLRAPSPRPTHGATPLRATAPVGRPSRRTLGSILRTARPPADPWVTVIVAALVCVGVLMVFSASALNSLYNTDDPYFVGSRQLIWAAVGGAMLLFVSSIDYRRLRAFATPLLIVALVLLLLVLLPGVPTERGFRRSLSLGPISIHAAEVAKLALVLFLAAHLSKRGHLLHDGWGTFLPAVAAVGVSALLVLVEPDLGSAIVVAGVGFTILFCSGLPLRWVLSLAGAGAGAMGLSLLFNSYQAARLGGFADPFSDPLGASYQTLQGLMAMALGGPLGSGLGSSQQPGGVIVPYSWNDYIFAVIGQEFGLLGALLVLLAFIALAVRGMRISRRAPDTFGALIAIGVTAWVCGQAFMNIGVVLALFPVTGVPLPLVSQGGSSLLVLLAAIGLLLSVSRETMGEPQRGGLDARVDRGRGNGGTPLPGIRRRPLSAPAALRR